MTRKISLLILLFLTVLGIQAQGLGPLTPLPLNPKVKTGVLENGLTYYILHNEEPKGKVNFYIAQKVGSALEEPNQLGLAHFLEHMAFNGSTHFPGNSMDKYYQSKGLGGGESLNAATGYDQTIYNINNVPTSDQVLMDSTLLALYDMSCGILLEEEEINAERGVIREEMRSRENAMQRMLQAISPTIFPEYGYQHPIIGSEEVIMNFTQDEIRAYYKKWYRPDLQAIIIVGDINADEMEKKVIELFSQIYMPANPAERVYPPFTGNEKPVYAHYTDPELGFNLALIMFKDEPVPFDQRNTLQMYIFNGIVQTVISKMINDRLQEFRLTPECTYASADVSFGDFLVSKSAEAFTVEVVSATDLSKATSQAMSVIARACKTGFTQSEYDRAKETMLSLLENKVKEKDKTSNNALAMELSEYFFYGEPDPGIEVEYQLWQQGLQNLPLELINRVVGELLTTDNLVVVVAQPEKEGMFVVGEEEMISTINATMNAEYEAYHEETIDEPLIANLPTPGKIVNKEESNLWGSVYTLSNGVKVIMKPTDYAADEIYFTALKKGGLETYEASMADNVKIMSYVFNNSKVGPFDQITLKKYLSGKKISLGLNVDRYSSGLQGKTTVKDLSTLLELIYTSFTNISPDYSAFNSFVESMKVGLTHQESNPEYIFSMKFADILYNGNPFVMPETVSMLEKVNYEESLQLVKQLLSNAAEFTYVFIGNVDESTLLPLLEQYIATLPVSPVTEPKVVSPIEYAKGNISKEFTQTMKTPTVIIGEVYSGYNVPVNLKNYILARMAGAAIMTTLSESLREDEGGTYSPYAMGSLNPELNCWQIMSEVITAPEKKDNIINRQDKELKKIFTEGSNEKDFISAKETMIQRYKSNYRKNSFMLSTMTNQLLHPDLPFITEYETILNSITFEDFNNFLKNLYNGENHIQVVLEGVAE